MPNTSWIDNLREAQDLLRDAHEIISDYCKESGDENAKAYLADHLRIMIDGQHGFLDSSLNVEDVIERIKGDEDDDEDDKEYEYWDYGDEDEGEDEALRYER
jgi:hypothetical protein